jgi:hypothetical protein
VRQHPQESGGDSFDAELIHVVAPLRIAAENDDPRTR